MFEMWKQEWREKELLAVRVPDDRMESEFHPGDILYFSQDEPSNGDIVLLDLKKKGEPLVGYFYAEPSGVRLVIPNRRYAEQHVARSKIKAIMRLHASMRIVCGSDGSVEESAPSPVAAGDGGSGEAARHALRL